MQVEFPFIKEKANIVDFILRPYAQVVLSGDIAEWFYIDSGADITLIPRKLGEYLGFKIQEEEEVKELRGLGESKAPYVIRKVNMEIGGKKFEVRIAWSLIEDVPIVLGRLDVFNKFDITFKEREGKIIFTD